MRCPCHSPSQTGVNAVKINGTTVYTPTEADPLDAALTQARPEHQKSPEYVFHKTVGFLNRTVNGQPLLMMRELEQALELRDPITADEMRRAAAAAAKKPPSYDQLLDLRKHFAKDIQQGMVDEARHTGAAFLAVEKPLLPALEHPPFDAFSLTATLKQLGKGARYSAGQPALKNMDGFLKQFFKYTEVVRQIETVKVSEIQKGLDNTREALTKLAASLTPEQQQLVGRIEGEIAHQQAEINVVASLADAVRLTAPQIALQGVSLASGSLNSDTIMEGVTGHMATLINASDAQRARTATELQLDMDDVPTKKKPYQKGQPKPKTKVSDSSGESTDPGAAKGYTKSPAKKMPPPSPRTPAQKRKPADSVPNSANSTNSANAKKPKGDTPANGKQPHEPPSAANTPPLSTPKGKQANKPTQHSGGKGGGSGGKSNKGNNRAPDSKGKKRQ